jgi:hypothetical protein
MGWDYDHSFYYGYLIDGYKTSQKVFQKLRDMGIQYDHISKNKTFVYVYSKLIWEDYASYASRHPDQFGTAERPPIHPSIDKKHSTIPELTEKQKENLEFIKNNCSIIEGPYMWEHAEVLY